MQKLVEQLDYGFEGASDKEKSRSKVKISEERATLLYVLDIYGKHLIEVESYPVRKVRDTLDSFTRDLVNAENTEVEDTLFRFRQFFSAYKTAEYAYLRKTFEDFKGIVWNFVEQLSDDAVSEQAADRELHATFCDLKDAVEADSIPLLRAKSRQFIDLYVSQQTKKEERRLKRARGVKKNLEVVKKQLLEADRSARFDHLTQAYNRKSFDEQVKQQIELFNLSKNAVSLIALDIDHFKKINDTYGHDIGDFILKECVKLLQEVFGHEGEFVARVGGEEFAVILPNHAVEHAVKRAEAALERIRKDVFVENGNELRFTASMGIAQLIEGERASQWIKRADQALYEAKHSGRNRYVIANQATLKVAI